MAELYKPEDEAQVADLLRYGLAEKKCFSITGNNSKSGFGYSMNTDMEISMSSCSGIVEYDPAELVMRARAGTSMTEIRQVLCENNQHLAFEPADIAGLYNENPGAGTIAGVFMANLSGSRRFQAGAARDHLLGFTGVNGYGDIYKSGGKVIKNVTGYDLSKVMSGSWGTLSVLSELSFKVLPKPLFSTTAVITGLDSATAMQTLSRLAGSPLQISGLAYIPENTEFTSPSIQEQRAGHCLLRFEGSAISVNARINELNKFLPENRPFSKIDCDESIEIWRCISNASMLSVHPVVMKLSIPPSLATSMSEQLNGIENCQWFADAAGAWFWIGLSTAAVSGDIQAIRSQLLKQGGSAVLYKAPQEVKEQAGLFSSTHPALAALHQRLKKSFDPAAILNPKRLDNIL